MPGAPVLDPPLRQVSQQISKRVKFYVPVYFVSILLLADNPNSAPPPQLCNNRVDPGKYFIYEVQNKINSGVNNLENKNK